MTDNQATPSEPPSLTDTYHKARRSYGFVAALLIAWELIGIEVTNEPFSAFRVQFKTPQAAPYVLIALIVYFAFRIVIEWNQNSVARRERLASRVDFWVAHALAALAIGIFAVQRFLQQQVAAWFTATTPTFWLLGFISGFGAYELIRFFRERQTDRLRLLFYLTAVVLPVAAITLMRPSNVADYLAAVSGLGLGAVFDAVSGALMRRRWG